MIILAIDPGPTKTGFAIARATSISTAHYLDGGHVDSTPGVLGFVLGQAHDVLAIERVGLAHRLEAAHSLIETSDIAGLVRGIESERRGERANIVRPSAVEWRAKLTGRTNAKDRDIKAVVQARVTGLPKRFGAHVADALGLALVVIAGIHMTALATRRSA